MTTHDKDKIIAAAKECGIGWAEGLGGMPEFLEAFYAIAFEAGRQAELEECAKIAETPYSGEQDDITMEAKDRVAKAIRARSTK